MKCCALRYLLSPLRRAQYRVLIVISSFVIFITFLLLNHTSQSIVELDPSLWQFDGYSQNNSIKTGGFSSLERAITYQPIYTPNCSALIKGNKEEVALISEMLFREVYKELGPEHYVSATGDCNEFKKNYPDMEPTSLEKELPLAFVIVAHETIEQLERLLRAIYRPWNTYCIHIDHKSPYIFHQALQGISKCFENVFIADKLEWVVYGGFSRLKADINCLEDLLTRDMSWKYIINLSGQEFPLKSNREIVTSLTKFNGMSDISGVIDRTPFIVDRYKYIHKHVLSNNVDKVEQTKELKPPPPRNVSIYHGTAYNIFSRTFVEYVIHDDFAQALLSWFADTYSPDEHYWATLQALPTTPGCQATDNWSAIVKAIKWKMFENVLYPPCTGKYVRGICIFGIGDLNWLVLQQHIFANKFNIHTDHVVYGCLEKYVHNKTYHI